jgi:methylaspartate mutase sigma subunit
VRIKFVLSSVPTDSHMWNLVALQLLLEELGHEVVNLGACVPVPLLLATCRAERPDCVVLSTVNGHGHVDGARVIAALRAEDALAGLTVVIGGLLGTRGGSDPRLCRDLLESGFDAVFPVGANGSAAALEGLQRFLASRFVGVP